MQRRALLRAGTAASLLAATPFVRAQGSLERIKFNLGWKVEGTAAGFLLAQQRGYYKDAGVDVTIDTGNGSAAAISRGPVHTIEGVAKPATACPSRRVTPCVPLHAQGAQRRGAGCGGTSLRVA